MVNGGMLVKKDIWTSLTSITFWTPRLWYVGLGMCAVTSVKVTFHLRLDFDCAHTDSTCVLLYSHWRGQVHVKYGHLEFGIPSDDLMTLHVDSGLAEGTCSNIHDDTHTFRPMFGFHFNNANGLGTATYNPHKEAVAMKISEWHLDQTSIVLDYPPIFLPEEFITDTLKHVVNVTTEAANAFLYDHPYVLPQGFQAKAPNPDVHLRHQDGCCNNIHGFVEITSTVPAGCIMCPQASLTETPPVIQPPPSIQADALSAPSARWDAQSASDTGGSVWATVFEHPSDTVKGCHMQDVGAVGASLPRSWLYLIRVWRRILLNPRLVFATPPSRAFR
jgi:hypothetical protein